LGNKRDNQIPHLQTFVAERKLSPIIHFDIEFFNDIGHYEAKGVKYETNNPQILFLVDNLKITFLFVER
jgi:hypothetical protein